MELDLADLRHLWCPVRGRPTMMEPVSFDRVCGGWWRRNVDTDGAAALRRSADRYLSFALDEG
jgi:hypothetical protein